MRYHHFGQPLSGKFKFLFARCSRDVNIKQRARRPVSSRKELRWLRRWGTVRYIPPPTVTEILRLLLLLSVVNEDEGGEGQLGGWAPGSGRLSESFPNLGLVFPRWGGTPAPSVFRGEVKHHLSAHFGSGEVIWGRNRFENPLPGRERHPAFPRGEGVAD